MIDKDKILAWTFNVMPLEILLSKQASSPTRKLN